MTKLLVDFCNFPKRLKNNEFLSLMRREIFTVEEKFLSYMFLTVHRITLYGRYSLIHSSSIYFEVLPLHRRIFEISTHTHTQEGIRK